MPTTTPADAQGLCNFVDLSPSPFHVCATVAATLTDAGFTQLTEAQVWPSEPGRYYLLRGGSLIAWSTEGADGDPAARSGSSAATPTAPTCGSSSTPTSPRQAGNWSVSNRTGEHG